MRKPAFMSLPSATQQKVLRLEQQVNDLLAEVAALKATVQALQQGQATSPTQEETTSNASDTAP